MGMNRALFDIDTLAQGIVKATSEGDRSALTGYTDTCLPRIWKYQEFSIWMTEAMHDAGDPTLYGRFQQAIARARIETLFHSTAAARVHSEYEQGLFWDFSPEKRRWRQEQITDEKPTYED